MRNTWYHITEYKLFVLDEKSLIQYNCVQIICIKNNYLNI